MSDLLTTWFDKQLLQTAPLSERKIDNFVCKKDYFGTPWQIGDYYLLFMTEHQTTDKIDVRLHSVSSKSLNMLDQQYTYIRTTNNIPVFILKEEQ